MLLDSSLPRLRLFDRRIICLCIRRVRGKSRLGSHFSQQSCYGRICLDHGLTHRLSVILRCSIPFFERIRLPLLFLRRLNGKIALCLLPCAHELLKFVFAEIAKTRGGASLPPALPAFGLASPFLDDIGETRVDLQHFVPHRL